MLQNVRLINYRSLKDTTIPLAPITLLTGTNGIGKTSVLEGLYFLLSPQVPDASVFSRYMPVININISGTNGTSNMLLPVPTKGYDYLSFWKECPTNGATECQVEGSLGTLKLSWEMKLSDFSKLDDNLKKIATSYGLQGGVGIPYAMWEWICSGRVRDCKNDEITDIDHSTRAVQQLAMEPRFSPRIMEVSTMLSPTACRYVDMSSFRHVPDKLPYQTEKLLIRALAIINPNVVGVRLDGNPLRLRVIFNDESENSLGTLGVGAETWTSMLLILAELASSNTSLSPIMFLADEIGAGIHYRKLGEMWDFLSKFLEKHPQIQMVLTTHSCDCIKAFCKTFEHVKPGNAQIVQLHKAKEKDGIGTTTYSHETFSNILIDNWEVRG